MKIWACAKDSNGFINRDDGRYKLFFIWQVLKMRRENPTAFSALTFFSTHSREAKRREMSAVIGGYFRYKNKDVQAARSGDSDGETLSHAFLVTILAQLETINFVFNDQLVPFTFTRLVAEETHLKFGNGNSYFPDLYGEFTDDNPYHKQWGGRVAIEICYKNQCSDQKIKDFLDHGIPIIEIKVTPGLQVEHHIREDDIEGSLERRYQKNMEIVSRQVYARIISNPVSTKFHRDYTSRSEKELNELSEKKQGEAILLFKKYREMELEVTTVTKDRASVVNERDELAKSSGELSRSVKDLGVELAKYKTAYTKKVHEVDDLRTELESERAAGFWVSIGKAFSWSKKKQKP